MVGENRRWQKILVHVALIVVALLVLFPLYWMLLLSFGPPQSGRITLLPDPQTLTLESYRYVLFESPFVRWLWNSFLVSALTVVIGVTVSMLGAYALARMQFRGRGLFGVSTIVTQMVPTILLAVPWYVLLVQFRLNNTYSGLVLTYLTLVLPFGIWMLYGYFTSFPVELEEAAFVDGCSRLRAIYLVVLPVSAPAVATVALFAFVLSWEEFLYAVMLMSSDSRITLTVGASRLISDQIVYFGYLGAYGTLSILPILAVFLALQRYIVGGLTAGAVK